MSSEFKNSLFIPFHSVFLLLAFTFSYLTALAWTSSMMLNSSGKMRHPYIVPDFRGETSSFSAINMKAVNLLVVFFMKLRKFPLIQVC